MPDPPLDHHTALLTTEGAIIKETGEWTLGGYMRQQHRGPTKLKIGVGYVASSKVLCANFVCTYGHEALLCSHFLLLQMRVGILTGSIATNNLESLRQ